MARHQGVRRRTRKQLNRSIQCKGDRTGYMRFSFTAEEALERVIRHLRSGSPRIDKRTNPGKVLVAAIARLETLRREMSR